MTGFRTMFAAVAHPNPPQDAGPEGDPGYLASLRTGSTLAQLRKSFLSLLAVPVLVLALSPLIIRIETHHLDTPPLWAAAAIVLVALGVLVVAPRLPRPLKAGMLQQETAVAASSMFRSTLFLRFTFCEGVVLSGLPLSMAADSMVPMLLAFGLGYPLLMAFALPTRGTIEGIRRRIEAEGAVSDLWASLLAPYEPPGLRASRSS